MGNANWVGKLNGCKVERLLKILSIFKILIKAI